MAIPSRTVRLAALAALAASAGCEKPAYNVNRPRVAPSAAEAGPAPPPVAVNPPEIKPRETLGKTTQDIHPTEPEIQSGAAQPAAQKVTAKDPITMPGNVYVVAIDRTAANNVKHAIDLYQAEHGEYPKTHQEFMDEIIKPGKPDGMVLPRLPYYQEYSYDAKEHKLVILEYPGRKQQFQEQQDRALGRK